MQIIKRYLGGNQRLFMKILATARPATLSIEVRTWTYARWTTKHWHESVQNWYIAEWICPISRIIRCHLRIILWFRDLKQRLIVPIATAPKTNTSACWGKIALPVTPPVNGRFRSFSIRQCAQLLALNVTKHHRAITWCTFRWFLKKLRVKKMR